MVGRLTRRQTWLVGFILFAVWGVTVPAHAQGATVQGVVKDGKGPAEGATVVIQSADGKKTQAKTDKKGAFSQAGVAAGDYILTASKGDLVTVPTPLRVSASAPVSVDLMLVDKKTAAAALASDKAEVAKSEATKTEFTTLFNAGATASSAGNQDEAITKFNAAIAISPACTECYNNIGYAYVQKKDYDKAEQSYKKANEIKPNATAYGGLTQVYTAQKKFDLASEASAKATEMSAATTGSAPGGNADALFNQGVTLWNGGKIDEAKKQFEAALKANPNHAEAHFQLGMALVNEGNLSGAAAEFDTYLKLAPSGPNAATAKSLVTELKK